MKYLFFINVEPEGRNWTGFQTGHPLQLAYAGDVCPDQPTMGTSEALNRLFEQFNINHPADYRNRSMSVGDVVFLFDGGQWRAFACAGVGWESLPTLTGIHDEVGNIDLCEIEGGASTRILRVLHHIPRPRSIQKVVIERAEGMTGHYTMKKVTFTGDTAEGKGNEWLALIAQTAPKSGGYDKTDVWVTLSNGLECAFRFDVQHTSLPDNDTDLRQHIRSWFLYHCRPEEIAHIARDSRRLAFAQKDITPESKAGAEALVALLDADLTQSTPDNYQAGYNHAAGYPD